MQKIDHLILIAGASCVGKTFLMKKINQGKCTDLCNQLGIYNLSNWRHTSVIKTERTGPVPANKWLVHYDLYRNPPTRLQPLLDASCRTTFLTLCAPSRTLIYRNIKRLGDTVLRMAIRPWNIPKELRLISHLRKRLIKKNHYTEHVERAYKRWFDFLEKHPGECYWLDMTKPGIPTRCLCMGNPEAPLRVIQHKSNPKTDRTRKNDATPSSR